MRGFQCLECGRKPEKLAKLKLSGEDGNAFFIMGRAQRAGERAGYSSEQLAAYFAEAKSGDYNNLLRVTMEWFDVS